MRQSVQELIERYQNNLYAIEFSICKNPYDEQDVVQDLRAWLIRVAINKAKNLTLTFWRQHKVSLEDYMENLTFEAPESENLFEEVMKLPQKYRIVIHLFYYEDYSIKEIAEILKLSQSNVKVRLSRARALLKESLKEEWNYDE